jgi:protein-tyrosine phosphatase
VFRAAPAIWLAACRAAWEGTHDAVDPVRLSRAREGVAVEVDSAGTGDWHLGHPPDTRAQAVAAKNTVDIGGLRARLVTPDDFRRFDYIVAMDASNLANLEAMRPEGAKAAVARLLDYAEEAGVPDVPDPYHGGPEGFDETYRLVVAGAKGLLEHIRREQR